MDKLSQAPLAELLGRCDLPGAAATVVANAADAPAAIEVLARHGFLIEAARLFAHALPKREAVWWACMCALHTAPPTLAAADAQAREHAELWVRNQQDETRRAAMAAAQTAGFQSPEAWAGVAAFWSGDSIAPLANTAIPPPAHLTGVAVSGAVALASVRAKPERQPARLKLFLNAARDIATGGPGRIPPEGAE
jgi:hypothetical protein